MKKEEKMYTEQEVKIMLIENNQTGLAQAVHRLEDRMQSLQHWTIGLMLGLYTLALSSLAPAFLKLFGINS